MENEPEILVPSLLVSKRGIAGQLLPLLPAAEVHEDQVDVVHAQRLARARHLPLHIPPLFMILKEIINQRIV
jgi:hypothetical protein